MAGEYQQQAIKETKIAIEEMISIVSKLSEETIRWKPSAEEWSIMQVVAHVVEAIPFWLGEINQIRQHPDEVWGRDHTHQGRLEAVQESRVDQLPVEELLQALAQLPEQTEQVLSKLTDEQLELIAPCRNPNFDGKPLKFIIDKLVVGHIKGHTGQIERNLSKLR